MKYKLLKLTVAFVACSAVTVAAGIVNTESPKDPQLKNTDTNGTVNTAVLARDTSSLRCWQDGQLLFEQTHLHDKELPGSGNMMVFTSNARGTDREIYLINNGFTTCLYEKI